MAIYSIDFGIDVYATNRASGTRSDPYPLQLALSQGNLIKDPKGRLVDFVPTGFASFLQVKGNDLVIFRVFDITSISGGGDNELSNVNFIETSFAMRNGAGIGIGSPAPWSAASPVAGVNPSKSHSLTFTRGGGDDLPCYFQWNDGIVVNPLSNPDAAVSYLLSFLIQAAVQVSDEERTIYFRADPEMVVSPDSGNVPPGPHKHHVHVPGHSRADAATSR